MLTLKLKNTQSSRLKIVECGLIDVVPQGRDFVIIASMNRDDKSPSSFSVSDDGETPYNVAYIENAAGATTQVIRPLKNGHG